MNTDDYNHIKTLKEAKRIIAEQDMIIGSQFRELTSLKDTQRRLNDCNSKRKREAGYDQWVSFDVVWDETLKKAQAQALHIPVVGCSLPSKEELISVYEKTIEEKHKGLGYLEREWIKLGFMYYHRYLIDKNKK